MFESFFHGESVIGRGEIGRDICLDLLDIDACGHVGLTLLQIYLFFRIPLFLLQLLALFVAFGLFARVLF